MAISVSQLKNSCLTVIRRIERTGQPVLITRRGKVVASIGPSSAEQSAAVKPWEALRQAGGKLLAKPGETAFKDTDFEALR
jgi:prevent-host-death family protein